MKVLLDDGAFAPARAHDTDAGLDLRAHHGAFLPAGGAVTVGTGTHIQLPPGTAGLLVSKSGLNCVRGITSTGLIDEGYTGEIMVRLYNHSQTDYEIEAGDKVSQLVVIPVIYEPVEIADSLEGGSERGNKGFGSSGR